MRLLLCALAAAAAAALQLPSLPGLPRANGPSEFLRAVAPSAASVAVAAAFIFASATPPATALTQLPARGPQDWVEVQKAADTKRAAALKDIKPMAVPTASGLKVAVAGAAATVSETVAAASDAVVAAADAAVAAPAPAS